MAQAGFSQHRALDDSKASREWLTKLDDMAVLIYGAPRRPTAISLAVMAKYYADKSAHREHLAREGRSLLDQSDHLRKHPNKIVSGVR